MSRPYAPISRSASSDRRERPRRADEIGRQSPARVPPGFTRRPARRRGRRPYLRDNNSETYEREPAMLVPKVGIALALFTLLLAGCGGGSAAPGTATGAGAPLGPPQGGH